MAFGVKYKVGLINAENGRGWLSNENGEDDETGCSSSREREEEGKNTGTPEINTEGQKAQTNRHIDTQTQKHTDTQTGLAAVERGERGENTGTPEINQWPNTFSIFENSGVLAFVLRSLLQYLCPY